MKISTQIDAFLTFLRACEQQYHMAVAEEQETNDLTNDLYHFMEFSDENPDKLLQMARELVKTRRRRRAAKDTVSELAPLQDWLLENQPVVRSLEALLGTVRKVERKNENRIYTPRILSSPPEPKTPKENYSG